MQPAIFQAFERLLRTQDASGELRAGRVLEIGAMPAADTLLNLPCLAGAAYRLGINLAPPTRQPGFEIRQGNANRLDGLADASFDLVLSNSTLEHDRRFWLSLAEMRRLLRPGGLLLLGVPGFGGGAGWRRAKRWMNLPGLRHRLAGWRAAELTLARHDMPADYWRFGEAAAREVLLEDLEPLAFERLLEPPRFLVAGRKP